MSTEELKTNRPIGSEPTILIVDDEPEIQSLLTDLINEERLGRVVVAGSRLEVRTILDELAKHGLKPDIVCLDLHLIGESGFTIMLEPELDGVPVLITSVLDDKINREAAQRLNLVGFRPKPFDITQIALDIARTINTKTND